MVITHRFKRRSCKFIRYSPDSSDLACASVAIASRVSLVAAEVLVMAITYVEMGHYRHSADIIRVFRKGLTLSCVFYENGQPAPAS